LFLTFCPLVEEEKEQQEVEVGKKLRWKRGKRKEALTHPNGYVAVNPLVVYVSKKKVRGGKEGRQDPYL
jgi:hypothetical protein